MWLDQTCPGDDSVQCTFVSGQALTALSKVTACAVGTTFKNFDAQDPTYSDYTVLKAGTEENSSATALVVLTGVPQPVFLHMEFDPKTGAFNRVVFMDRPKSSEQISTQQTDAVTGATVSAWGNYADSSDGKAFFALPQVRRPRRGPAPALQLGWTATPHFGRLP